MIARYLMAGGAVLALLAGVAGWLLDAGYRNGMADCQSRAERIRSEIEQRWIRDADAIANQERDDAVAAIDAGDAGDDICLAGDSLQPLKAIR